MKRHKLAMIGNAEPFDEDVSLTNWLRNEFIT